MSVDFAIPDTGTADSGAVLSDDERRSMDFQWEETIISALLVEFTGAVLGFCLRRDDQSIDILTSCSRTMCILQLDDFVGCGVGVAQTIKFCIEALATFLKRAEKFGVGWIIARLLGKVG